MPDIRRQVVTKNTSRSCARSAPDDGGLSGGCPSLHLERREEVRVVQVLQQPQDLLAPSWPACAQPVLAHVQGRGLRAGVHGARRDAHQLLGSSARAGPAVVTRQSASTDGIGTRGGGRQRY
jgi:hypothetical protein